MDTTTKPGYKTTEFWVTILTQVFGILAVLGILTPEQTTALSESFTQITGAIVITAASFGYSLSRGKAKAKANIIEK